MRVKISGWKSFREVEIRFGQLNVLIGSNGSGKSKVLSFFEMFRAVTESGLKPYWIAHGRAEAEHSIGLWPELPDSFLVGFYLGEAESSFGFNAEHQRVVKIVEHHTTVLEVRVVQ